MHVKINTWRKPSFILMLMSLQRFLDVWASPTRDRLQLNSNPQISIPGWERSLEEGNSHLEGFQVTASSDISSATRKLRSRSRRRRASLRSSQVLHSE
ncbi:uncharacterized protein BDZ99DRAFT_49704 [Mytilinidion resinicola]|uniref:Uncharacterized protein n=1 Tax=Mytilinidion resinicola TaxID=574789 RepID=A0A6A6YI28_9PEZI|nr:uncharacterized protein BDZ99DRAFT_49704 [Mytilinidion resinicola]KAF2808229.1 hypothetical protein BDZ99DRAFT_49704 [Mytilinidion resinicola]